MSIVSLAGKRVLVTQADDFMGPALCEALREVGAEVIAEPGRVADPKRAVEILERAGTLDALVLNLAVPAPATRAEEVGDAEWSSVFSALVDPMMWLVRAALPGMIQRRSGKIVLMGSAAALRGQSRRSSYSAARGAQLAYIQCVGVEVAKHGVQVNAIAQNFVENPTYYPPEVQARPELQERMKWQVPLGRLVSSREDAMFAAYLCSDAASCFVGQVFPVAGGWVTR